MPLLADWDNFYVIIGSSAGALTGLMFVVIALGAEARTASTSTTLRAFASPTVVHFCVVLLLAAIATVPRHTITTLRVSLLACGVGGLGYGGWVLWHARRQQSYVPVLSDWVWHTALPPVAYTAVSVGGLLLPRSPDTALEVVGAAALLLLFIGIHNAWDSAVWMTMRAQKR